MLFFPDFIDLAIYIWIDYVDRLICKKKKAIIYSLKAKFKNYAKSISIKSGQHTHAWKWWCTWEKKKKKTQSQK